MNREIKFKIWDKVDKKFLSLKDYQDLGAIEVENDGALTFSPRFRFLTSMMIMPDKFIPCQWTGLKDKNGKEIYEGDIIEYKDSTGLHRETVVFDKGCFYAGWHSGSSTREAPKLINTRISTVIGNIYESEVTNAKD